jgi:hypothetical protein
MYVKYLFHTVFNSIYSDTFLYYLFLCCSHIILKCMLSLFAANVQCGVCLCIFISTFYVVLWKTTFVVWKHAVQSMETVHTLIILLLNHQLDGLHGRKEMVRWCKTTGN